MTEIPPPRPDLTELDRLEAEEHGERRRLLLKIVLIFLIAIPLAIWVGTLINDSQSTATKAEAQTEQAQVEKFNLAQQIAAACADPDGLDEDTQARLCADARTIVREGPQGAQGVPGVQGLQGIQGIRGFDGLPGTKGEKGDPGLPGTAGAKGDPGLTGPAGPQGAQGDPGVQGAQGDTGGVGEQGIQGERGEPPFSWVVFNERGDIIETCTRADPFDEDAPTYTCTRG